MTTSPLTLFLFALAAALYAMVGHGGGSAYLALMGLLGWPHEQMRITALTLNLAVAGLAWLMFLSRGGFRWKLFALCALAGVPAAWLGGKLGAPAPAFWGIVGLALVIAAYRTAFPKSLTPVVKNTPETVWIPVGGALGFVAGTCGIGGGVFLGPVLILAGAATPFEAAGVSAAYIFVNSAAGLAAITPPPGWSPPVALILTVTAAGAIGAYLGSRRATPLALRRALAAALTVAAAKCFMNAI